jgi:hypothetical protein
MLVGGLMVAVRMVFSRYLVRLRCVLVVFRRSFVFVVCHRMIFVKRRLLLPRTYAFPRIGHRLWCIKISRRFAPKVHVSSRESDG